LDKEKANPYFISYSIHSDPSLLHQIKNNTRGAIMGGLNLGIIKKLRLKLPPIELQNHFETIFKQVESIRDKMQKSLGEMDNLFHSLMQRAFKGELKLNEEAVDSLMERKVPAANSDAELAALDTELMMNLAGCDSTEPKPEFTDIIKFIKHVFSNQPFRFSELMHEAKDQTTDYEKMKGLVFNTLRVGLNAKDEHLKQCFFDETFDSGDEALNKKLRGTIGFQVCEDKK
jgi:hypothetical protein